jgi:hypothetical protein
MLYYKAKSKNAEEEVLKKSACKGYPLLHSVRIVKPLKISGRNIKYSSSPTQLRKIPFKAILGVGFSSQSLHSLPTLKYLLFNQTIGLNFSFILNPTTSAI